MELTRDNLTVGMPIFYIGDEFYSNACILEIGTELKYSFVVILTDFGNVMTVDIEDLVRNYKGCTEYLLFGDYEPIQNRIQKQISRLQEVLDGIQKESSSPN